MPPWKEAGPSASFRWLPARELLLPNEPGGPKFGRERRRIDLNSTTGVMRWFLSLFFFHHDLRPLKTSSDLNDISVKARDRRSTAFFRLEHLRVYWSAPELHRRYRFEPRLWGR